MVSSMFVFTMNQIHGSRNCNLAMTGSHNVDIPNDFLRQYADKTTKEHIPIRD